MPIRPEKEEFDPEFGRRFKMAHLQSNLRDLNQGELGKHFGVSQQTVSNWANGIRIPQPVQCREICEAFGVNVEWIYTGRGDRHPSADPMLRHAHALMDMDWKVKDALNYILLMVEKEVISVDQVHTAIEDVIRRMKVLPI